MTRFPQLVHRSKKKRDAKVFNQLLTALGTTLSGLTAWLQELTGGGETELHAHAGGADSGIQYVDVQLTDAQIKALPTTPVTVMAAPGAGLAYLVRGAYALCDTTGGAYAGLGTDSGIYVRTGAMTSAGGLNDDGASGQLTDFLAPGTPGVTFAWFPEIAKIGFSTTFSPDPGPIAVLENQPVTLAYFNNEGTALTDGHASNTLSVRVWYSVVPAVPFGGA